jgi:hypothetical protein
MMFCLTRADVQSGDTPTDALGTSVEAEIDALLAEPLPASLAVAAH